MNTELFDAVAEELACRVDLEVEAQAASVEPQFFSMQDIRAIISAEIGKVVSGLGFAGQLELAGSMPGAADASPEMQTMRFSFGEHLAAVLHEALEQRLLAVRYESTFAHYEGRITSIMRGAGDLAAALVEGPAGKVVKSASVEAYREGLDRIFADADAPSAEFMDALLCRACEFFSPLDKCLERPEWGLPAGITEQTVGRTAVEVRSWFSMVADLQHLNLRRPDLFSRALADEMSAVLARSAP
jgi:hypothetical protein